MFRKKLTIYYYNIIYSILCGGFRPGSAEPKHLHCKALPVAVTRVHISSVFLLLRVKNLFNPKSFFGKNNMF
jgi:hypothetical protein